MKGFAALVVLLAVSYFQTASSLSLPSEDPEAAPTAAPSPPLYERCVSDEQGKCSTNWGVACTRRVGDRCVIYKRFLYTEYFSCLEETPTGCAKFLKFGYTNIRECETMANGECVKYQTNRYRVIKTCMRMVANECVLWHYALKKLSASA